MSLRFKFIKDPTLVNVAFHVSVRVKMSTICTPECMMVPFLEMLELSKKKHPVATDSVANNSDNSNYKSTQIKASVIFKR